MGFGRCSIPGCYRGTFTKYCGAPHKLLGEKGCILCRKESKWKVSEFCYRCDTTATNSGPLLVLVPEDNEAYRAIADEFNTSWKHPTACPKVGAVYKIISSKNVFNKYRGYRNEVEARGRFISRGLPPGNEQQKWHGTSRKCCIGDKGQTFPCVGLDCSLCSIIRASFDISHAKKKTRWGRFGRGIYTSSASSKANDYSTNLGPSHWKATLLVYIVLGKTVTYTTNQTSLTQPPTGFDSVIGEPSTSGSLNYDEQVVYINEAICPAYLVMYRS